MIWCTLSGRSLGVALYLDYKLSLSEEERASRRSQMVDECRYVGMPFNLLHGVDDEVVCGMVCFAAGVADISCFSQKVQRFHMERVLWARANGFPDAV